MKQKLREEEAARSEEEAAKYHAEYIEPLMADVDALLKENGDTVSPKALEALAKWKRGY